MGHNIYRFELVYNMARVCSGEGTLESVSRIVEGHFARFGGARFEAWKDEQAEQGEAQLLLECNGQLKLTFADPTGHAIARAWYYTKDRPR